MQTASVNMGDCSLFYTLFQYCLYPHQSRMFCQGLTTNADRDEVMHCPRWATGMKTEEPQQGANQNASHSRMD